MIQITHSGNFNNTETFLKRVRTLNYQGILDNYGKAGVVALSASTPVDSGITSNSWGYTIQIKKNYFNIIWTNSHTVSGIPLVILLQYGHGTGTGGYVSGRDFINPAVQPIFDKIAEDIWKEVTT